MCRLNHWSQSRIIHLHPCRGPFMGEIHFFPCDFLFSQVTCFGHDTSRSLTCACKTRPTCFYLGRDHKSCSGQPAGPTEWETDLEAAHSQDPSPARPAQPTPSQCACEWGKINVVWSHWVGVGSMQHYWNKSWWRKSQTAKIRESHKPRIYKLMEKQSLSPSISKECFQKHLSSPLLHLRPQALSSNRRWRQLLKYQMWAENKYRFKTQIPAEKSTKGLPDQRKGKNLKYH